jgi:hypothetical protein
MSHKFKVGDRVQFIINPVLVGSVTAIQTLRNPSNSGTYLVYTVLWDGKDVKYGYFGDQLKMAKAKLAVYSGDLNKYSSPYIKSVSK